MAAASDTIAAQPVVTAQIIGNAFVQQYYQILHHSPELVFRFYQDISKLGRPEEDGSMSITTTMQAINEKILALNFADFIAEIKSVDAQESFNGGVSVLVTGCLIGKDNMIRNFSQFFFLAPQDPGYFVLNDMLRFVDIVNQHDRSHAPVADMVPPATPEKIIDPPQVQENHISEERIPAAEEPSGGKVFEPPSNGNVPIIKEEVLVAEVVNEVQDDSHVLVESNTKIEEVPKRSYASIVMHLNESVASFSPPVSTVPQKHVVKNVEQVIQPKVADGAETLASDVNMNNQETEGHGYSVYIGGLPHRATESMLAEEFKKFGPIKNGGVQVRHNRLQGFCFGFVEFEKATAVQKAIEASSVMIGGCQVVVEEKKSTMSRGNRKFVYGGRGDGFRNEGARGRGNYGGGNGNKGYTRGEFYGRNQFNNNRGGNNRGADGYMRMDNVGPSNRAGGMPNGTSKDTTQIAVTA